MNLPWQLLAGQLAPGRRRHPKRPGPRVACRLAGDKLPRTSLGGGPPARRGKVPGREGLAQALSLLHDPVEVVLHLAQLPDELCARGCWPELHGLDQRPAAADELRRGARRLNLCLRVSEHNQVQAEVVGHLSVAALQDLLEGLALPCEGIVGEHVLEASPGRDDRQLLERGQQGGEEVPAALLHPRGLPVCHNDRVTQLHGMLEDLLDGVLELLQLALDPAPRVDRRGAKQRIIPVEDDQRLAVRPSGDAQWRLLIAAAALADLIGRVILVFALQADRPLLRRRQAHGGLGQTIAHGLNF
mmetsp:Transcript_11644/g.31765  ORF Transcript_11644/g.31765 Transcript_11644/m.31765 type:complete len:301 (+) Transcript_11644:123-1025(+)